MRKFKPVLLVILLVACGVIGALIVVEALTRIAFHLHKESRWNDRPPFYFADERVPTSQDYPHSRVKAPGTYRIAVVGDSYTFAPYMQFTDAFPKVLERMLNLNNTPLRAEVINHAVPALSTHHEVGVAAKAIEEAPDLLLLQITLNDAEYKALTPRGIQENAANPFAALPEDGFYGFARRYWKSAAFVMERIHNTRSHRAYVDYFRRLFERKKTWDLFETSIRKMAKATSKRNIPMVAVVFPLFGVPLDGEYPFHGLHDKIGALLDAVNVPHLDLYETYAGIPVERLQVIPGEDRHPNEIAHRMAGERIYSWLVELNRIPEDFRIRLRFKNRMGLVNQRE